MQLVLLPVHRTFRSHNRAVPLPRTDIIVNYACKVAFARGVATKKLDEWQRTQLDRLGPAPSCVSGRGGSQLNIVTDRTRTHTWVPFPFSWHSGDTALTRRSGLINVHYPAILTPQGPVRAPSGPRPVRLSFGGLVQLHAVHLSSVC